MVLAVILVFAVCRLNTIKTSFLRKPLSRRNNNFQVLRFLRISADPASGAYPKHSQASGLPKPMPLGIPRPIFCQKPIGFFIHSVLYYFHIWSPWNLKLSIGHGGSDGSPPGPRIPRNAIKTNLNLFWAIRAMWGGGGGGGGATARKARKERRIETVDCPAGFRAQQKPIKYLFCFFSFWPSVP